MLKNTLLTSACALALQSSLSAATIIDLAANQTNAPGAFGTVFGNVLTDPFAYNPLDPTSVAPVTNFNASTHYHPDQPPLPGEDTFNIVSSFTLDHTVITGETTIVFDIWGRSGSPNSLDRDDSYQVELFDNGTSLGVAQGGITDDTTVFDRVEFDLAAGTTITDLVFTGFDSEASSANNNFTIAELRLAAIPSAIPEPSSTLMLGLSGLALMARRRRK